MDSCIELANYALRVWNEGLSDLARNSLFDLLNDFRRIYEDFKEFKSRCYNIIDSSVYKHYESVFNIALLKLSTAIEDKIKDDEVKDESVKFAVKMFTFDEKNIIREFERFSGLDISPEILTEIIVSRKGEVYELVKEAVYKQYVDFTNIVKTWSSKYSVSDSIRRGLILRYETRFKNVIEAFKRLLEQQPAWLTRLFSEYEEALLSSAEIRSIFERELKEVYTREISVLRERLENLEQEREELLNKLVNLGEKATSREIEREALEKELKKLSEEYEFLRSRYHEALIKWEERSRELKDLKNKLIEKEKQLEEMVNKEKELTASREALEAEITRLRGIVLEYENRVKDYERVKKELLLELKSMEDKVNVLEKIIKGEIKERLVTSDEATILEHIFIEKFKGKMKNLPITIAPWGEEITISKWNYEELMSEVRAQTETLPENTALVFGYKSRRLMGLGEERVIEIWAIYLSHLDVLEKQGFDVQPATLSDLIRVLKRIEKRKRSNKEFVIVGIASPTGWDEHVYRYVSGEEYSLVFENKVIILVDLHENKVIYPERLSSAMPTIDRFARMFTPETKAEEEMEVEETIKTMCEEGLATTGIPYFLYKEFLEKVKGVSELSLIRVLYRLEKKGYIKREKINNEQVITCKEGVG